ncbi:MAG: hypothetical protein ABI706_21020 [Ilumatobacteraceae bacterium]
MINEDLPHSAESASAFLDGELAASERAAAGADPEIMATVESFTRVRAVLSDVEPVADGTKASAIAAALAEFNVLRAPASRTATPAAAATVISLQSRRLRVYRVVMGVAAAAVVVVAIAALGSIRGEDAKSSSSATQPPAAEALPQLKVAATAAAAAGGAPSAQSSEASLPTVDSPAELQEFAASAASGDLAAATSPARAGTAAPAVAQPSPSDGPFSQAACINSDQVVLGDISYQGTPAYAVRNITTGALQALDATDCHVLVEAPAP